MLDEPHIAEVVAEIDRRATLTPSLTAVRVADTPVTYRALSREISTYTDVVTRHGLCWTSAFYAALLRCAPALARIGETAEQVQVVSEVIGWLARTIEPTATPRTGTNG